MNYRSGSSRSRSGMALVPTARILVGHTKLLSLNWRTGSPAPSLFLPRKSETPPPSLIQDWLHDLLANEERRRFESPSGCIHPARYWQPVYGTQQESIWRHVSDPFLGHKCGKCGAFLPVRQLGYAL